MFQQIAVLSVLALASVNALYGGYGHHEHQVPLAIKSDHHISYHEVPSYGHPKSTNVIVEPNYAPINMLFKTASSPMHVQQIHQSAPGSHQSSHSEDEPHKLYHQVTKPVIQEIVEIVTPYRKIVQEIKPVVENIETIVAKKGGELGGGLSLGGGALGGGNYGHGGYGTRLSLGGMQHY